MRKWLLIAVILVTPWVLCGCWVQSVVESPEAQAAVAAAVAPTGFGWAVPLLMNGLSALCGFGAQKLSHNKTVKATNAVIETGTEWLRKNHPEVYQRYKEKVAERALLAGQAVGDRLFKLVKKSKNEKI